MVLVIGMSNMHAIVYSQKDEYKPKKNVQRLYCINIFQYKFSPICLIRIFMEGRLDQRLVGSNSKQNIAVVHYLFVHWNSLISF